MNITIIGGGLTGLTAAYYLGHAKPDWHIQIYEQAPRLGGKIQTERVGDFVVELGPDSYLGRKMEMTDLVVDLGLGHTLVSNATGQAYVYDRGTTHPIPGGSIMGVPTEMMPFVKASLISWSGKLRAGLDFFKKPYPLDKNGDVSIGHFFKYHLGQEMMDKLIEPLLAGIYGGDIYKISLLSTFPHFIQVEQKYGNMVKGMMAAKVGHKKANVSKAAQGEAHVGDVPRAGKETIKDKDFDEKEKSLAMQQGNALTHKQPPAPQHNAAKGTASQSGMFRQLTGGLESVIHAIVEQMPSNVTITTQTEVSNIDCQGEGYTLLLKRLNDSDGNSAGIATSSTLALGTDESLLLGTDEFPLQGANEVVETSVYTDALIIATPPASYRQWFRHDEVFDAVRNMEQSSCAIAIMAFQKETFDGELKGSGLLITRHTDTPLTACTILNQKWPQTTGDDTIVLRVFIGKPGNDAIERYNDEELAQLAVREIQKIMNFSAEPEWVKMNRLVRSMPQYNVGHRAAVNTVKAHVKAHYPNLYLIGTPFDGIGIPDGVKQAKELVNQLVEY